MGVIGLFRHAPSLTFSLDLVEVEALPSEQVVLSCPSLDFRPTGTMASSDFSHGFFLDFASSAYTIRYGSCGLPTV